MAIATAFCNLGAKVTPEEVYAFAKKNHCTTDTGVVVMSLLQKLCRSYPVDLKLATCFSEQALFSMRYENAQVIGQVFGSEKIFSPGGLHFMTMVKAGSNQFMIVDPDFREDKYPEAVKVYPKRQLIVADYSLLERDADGTPMYYILVPKEG